METIHTKREDSPGSKMESRKKVVVRLINCKGRLITTVELCRL